MQTLRIHLCDGEVALYGERTYQEARDPRQFWDRWNSQLTRNHWHRTELDRDGNPYTVKWESRAFRNGRGAWMELTMAMEADGEHPACIRRAVPDADPERPEVPLAQQGRANIGERLRSPNGMWTVTESWIAQKAGAEGGHRDYVSRSVRTGQHVYYLLTHEDGHQEEWSAPGMGAAGFHRIQTNQQQTLT